MLAAFCPWCGGGIQNAWSFCPRCGRGRESLDEAAPTEAVPYAVPPNASPPPTELEANLRARIRETLAAAPRVQLARLLLKRYEFQEARTLLDEALEVAPNDFDVHLARAQHFAHLGLYPQALAEMKVLRNLQSPDLETLLFSQELYRWVNERSRGGFTSQPALPHLPRWLKSIRRPFLKPRTSV